MATCQACGADIPDDSRFCGQCGREVAPTVESTEEAQVVPAVEAPTPEEVPPVASGEPPGQTTTKPSMLGWIRTTKGAAVVGIVVVLIAGGVIFGVVRHNALARSGVAYTEAQTDIQGGNLKTALSELQEVVSYDPNYQKAQNEITSVKQAQDIVTIADSVLRDSSKFDSDLSSFWQHYNAAVDKTNAAWDDYSSYYDSSNAQQDIQGVDAIMAGLGNDSSSIGQDVSSISADLGEATSNSLLKDSNASALLDNYKDSSDQSNIISTTMSDESNSLESGNFVYGAVPGYINTTNAANSDLQSDQLKCDQGTAQFLGYAMGVVDKLLGQPIKLNNINNNA